MQKLCQDFSNTSPQDYTALQLKGKSKGVITTSARESKLSMMVAPLVQGNSRTWMRVHVKDDEGAYHSTRNILMSCEVRTLNMILLPSICSIDSL